MAEGSGAVGIATERGIAVITLVFILTIGAMSIGPATHEAARANHQPGNDARPFNLGLSPTIPVGTHPVGIAYDSAKGELFVTNYGSNNVSVISDSTRSVVATIAVGASPYDAAYDSGRGEIFVGNEKGGTVSVINDTNNTVVKTISTGGYPIGVAYDGGAGEVFVAGDQTSVYVISDSSNSVVATVGVGNVTDSITYDPTHGGVYTAMFDDATVWRISTATNLVTAIIPVGGNPIGIATDVAKGEVFTANSVYSNSSVISTASNKVITNLRVGSGASAVAYDQAQGDVFVTNSGSNNVTVISDSTTKVVANFPVGSNPYGVGFDDAKSLAFVTNYGSNNVTLVAAGTHGGGSTHYSVTFVESGLPQHTTWSVALNGSGMTGSNPTLSFSEVNGSYSFSVSPVTGYAPTPSSGPVVVSGKAVNVSVAFAAIASGPYAVTFTETGLPAGSTWQVTLNGSTQSTSTTGTTFTEPNGMYAYTVFALIDYAPIPSHGNVSVAGSALTQAIVFYEVYPLAFAQMGLPPGTNWSATLTPTQPPAVILLVPSGATGVTRWSDGASTIKFSVSNGTYSYTTSAAGHSSTPGSVTVSGQSLGPLSVPFNSTSSGGGPAIPWTFVGAGVGVVLVLVVGVVALLVMRRRRDRGSP
ncbi:MAG: YncE family protein [Thermoplasmata archaeon]|nr:YncE family protein [Thermoplasmata archaeon]